MAATYTKGGADPISRLRVDVPDTDTASAVFDDEELHGFLEGSLSEEYLLLYVPDTVAGVTAATVEVKMVVADLVLSLQRTTSPAESASTITLAKRAMPYRVGDLVDAISALKKKWRIGLGTRETIDWVPEEYARWRASIVHTTAMVRFAKAEDLALTRAGTISAYGDGFSDESKAAKLRLYQFDSALLRALQQQALSGRMLESYSEGDVSWRAAEGGGGSRMGDVAQRASLGIYSRV